jgi:hypothetical protein
VLSRLNYLGERVGISIRGNRAELASDKQERLAYASREGAYYGDIFAYPARYFACVSPRETSLPRVCGPSLDDCVVEVVGSCDAACDAPRDDGSFPNCRDHARTRSGKFPRGVRSYGGTVTVFLR